MNYTLANGKICYLELPAADVSRAASFYTQVFGWSLRTRGDGSTAFDDGVEVSGAFTTKRRPSTAEPGLLIYVMVNDMAATCRTIQASGGTVVWRSGPEQREVVATFRDPDGNLLGLYQQASA